MEDILDPIEPTVEDADEAITSYSRRSTLIGHQLNRNINPLEVPEGTQIPVVPTDVNDNQGEDVHTPLTI